MSGNIYAINEMIDCLNDFFSSESRNITVGGMAGSDIFKHVIDAAMSYTKFGKILVVEGCQDYIGLMKKPLVNHIFYAELFVDVLCEPLVHYDPFKPKIFNPKPEFEKQISTMKMNGYEVIIVKDGHLIPTECLYQIRMNFCGKTCIIVDPFDIGGDLYIEYPTLVDSLSKMSPMLAMARSTYGVDTRAIDRSVRGSIVECKVNKRSVGKIDDKQYITNDPYLADIIRHRQLQSSFRKRQKLFVTSDRIHVSVDKVNSNTILAKNSMCVIDSSHSKPLMRLRIYSSKTMFYGDVSYMDDTPPSIVQVKPANILMIDESCYHRYNTSVLIMDQPVTQRQKYSVLKNSNNVIVGRLK